MDKLAKDILNDMEIKNEKQFAKDVDITPIIKKLFRSNNINK